MSKVRRMRKLVAVMAVAMGLVLLDHGLLINAGASATVASATPDYRQQVVQTKRQNSDTVAWLTVPGTDINTAIVQNPYTKGNSYYLTHDFNGRSTKNGTYCADRRCSFDGTSSGLSQFTTLYAHSWDDDPDGELFSQLKRYKDPDFALEHPYIYLSLENEATAWEVFAVYDTTVDFPYVWAELPSEGYAQVMRKVMDSSLYNYGKSISSRDKVLTLSTCTYSTVDGKQLPLNVENDYRFVIMARLVEQSSDLKETATFYLNKNPTVAMIDKSITKPWVSDLMTKYGAEYFD